MSTANEPNSGPEPERAPEPPSPEAPPPSSVKPEAPEAVKTPRQPPIIVQQLSTPVTLVLIVVNVAIFSAMIGSARTPALLAVSNDTLIEWGANFGPLSGGKEPWRMFTTMFLHVGFLHIAVNMWALWNLRLVERFFGSLRYLALYILSGFAGSCATMIFNPVILTAGASAALFGVMGGLLAYATLEKRNTGNPVFKNMQMSVFKTIALNAALFMLIPRMERAGTATGLIFGTLAGLLIAPLPIRFIPLGRDLRAVVTTIGLAVMLVVTARLTTTHLASDQRVQTVLAGRDFYDFIEQMRPVLQENEKNTKELNELLNMPVASVPKERSRALAQRGDEALKIIDAMELKNFGVQKLHQLLLKDVAALSKTLHAFDAYVNEPKWDARNAFRSELQQSNTATHEFDDAIKAYRADHGLLKDDEKKANEAEPPAPEKIDPDQTF